MMDDGYNGYDDGAVGDADDMTMRITQPDHCNTNNTKPLAGKATVMEPFAAW